jgi:nicotinamidase-related amidase
MNAASLTTLAEQVDPRVAALLVIDMQNDFCHPEGVSGKRGRQLAMSIEMAPRLESTLRDGYMRDYYIVLLEDCVGATNVDLHKATLKNVKLHFGTVSKSTEVAKLWSV